MLPGIGIRREDINRRERRAPRRGPVVLAVHNLPAELPLESSIFFSSGLKGFVPDLAWAAEVKR